MERLNLHYDVTPTVSGTPEFIDSLDPVAIGYTGYEAHVKAVTGSVGHFGELALVWRESGQSSQGDTTIDWRGELGGGGFVCEGPIRGPKLDLYYTSLAANAGQLTIDLTLTMGQFVPPERGLPKDTLLLNSVYSVGTGAQAVSEFTHAALATGPATLVLGAPTKKGTFRVQFGGTDFEDIAVAAGTSLRVPYVLPRRSMSVRVTNTDTASGSFSARLIGGVA